MKVLSLVPVVAAWFSLTITRAPAFDFKIDLLGEPARIFANIEFQDNASGFVRFNGVALDLASEPLWDFGDGTVVGSWFPAEHTYASARSNYIVQVTGYFTDGTSNSTKLVVRFAPPVIAPVALSPQLCVTIPTTNVALQSRMSGYGFSPTLTHFDDSFFSPQLPRSTVEYVLSVAASVQNEMVNSNVVQVAGGFRQSVLRDPAAGGMYSIWFSTPVAFGSGDYGFQGAPAYSSFFHEMGHNVTLNFPAAYCYGGKIDGNANAIYSETLAQIFQHATAYEIINHPARYGLPPDLVLDIYRSARDSIVNLRSSYERYLSSGTNFCSWNDPATPEDDTFDTFMTIAYQFCAHAEGAEQGYVLPVQRMMRLLEVFNPDLHIQYSQDLNTPAAEQFRATLLVAALCYAFQTDLRAEFRNLRFPISDAVYEQLMSLVSQPLRVTEVSFEGANVRVSWNCNPNQSYVLQTSTNLVADPFADCSPALHVPGNFGGSTTNSVHLNGAAASQRFYRVRLVP